MNGQHLRAFLWLHWRLRANQFKKGGVANTILLILIAVGGLLLAVFLLVVFFAIGMFALADASPAILMYVWDGLVGVFLFLWMMGLLSDLQRSEAVSLQKFLHLPVSLSGVFLLNYLSSLLSLSLIVFVPAMCGLVVGLLFARGPAMLLLVPLVAAFLLMVTALTYQFQGWLASLMVNKRRRRTIIVFVTVAFILLAQLPNLFNVFQPWKEDPHDTLTAQMAKERSELQQALNAREITLEQFKQRDAEIQKKYHEQRSGQVEQIVRLVNLVLPPGWLPLGALSAAEGNVLGSLLGTLGMGLIGTASLWRSYRTTVRLYTGQFTSGKRADAPAAAAPPVKTGQTAPAVFLERQLPWLSEHAAAIALSGFRSLTRAPEAKMMLLSPIILVVVFGGLFLRGGVDMAEVARPLLAFGAIAMILMMMTQLVGNQFGFDRGGFRVFVLCPARRKDVLLGKNLAAAPLALALAAVALVFVQVLRPMRFDHFLALLPQGVSMYLLFCVLANWLSIFAPMPIAQGTLKPTNVRALPIILHIVFMFLFPVVLAPTLLPLGIELLMESLGWVRGLPVALALSLVECVVVLYLYDLLLSAQGRLLQAREQKILEIVTTKAE